MCPQPDLRLVPQQYATSVAASDNLQIMDFENDLDDFIVPTGEDSKVSAVDIAIRRKN